MPAVSTGTEHELSIAPATESGARPHPPDPAGPLSPRIPAMLRRLRLRLRLRRRLRLRPRLARRRRERTLTPRDAALHGSDPHLKYHSFPRHLR